MLQRVDEKIIEKISELVGEGVRSVEEMKRHLRIFVKDDLFRGRQQPERNNRRYYPKGKTIKNHMYSATINSRLSAIDQDNVEEVIRQWKNEERRSGDNFFFALTKKVVQILPPVRQTKIMRLTTVRT